MKAQTIQDLFQLSREEWLNQARHTAEQLLRSRPTVTVEDILAICPRPEYIHRNVTGHIFQAEVFKHAGFTKSKRPISNGRVIGVWTLKAEYYPVNYRTYRRRNLEEVGSDN